METPLSSIPANERCCQVDVLVLLMFYDFVTMGELVTLNKKEQRRLNLQLSCNYKDERITFKINN